MLVPPIMNGTCKPCVVYLDDRAVPFGAHRGSSHAGFADPRAACSFVGSCRDASVQITKLITYDGNTCMDMPIKKVD